MNSADIELQRFEFQELDQNLFRSIDSTQDAIEAIEQDLTLTTKVTAGSGFVVTVGVTSWMFRSSSLVSAMLSSVPVWKRLDPLPVLSLSGKELEQRQRRLKDIEEDEHLSDRKISHFFSEESNGENEGGEE